MNRKILFLNLALLALAGTLVWQLRVRWLQTRENQRSVLAKAPRPQTVQPPPPQNPSPPATPADYLDVAQRTLFSRDRNPNVVIEPPPPPPPPPPEKPLPPLPLYHGQMSLGTPVVVLSLNGENQKSYHTGDEVGPFKLVEFDRESIVLEFEGKSVERKLAELKPKEAPQALQAAAASQTGPPPSSAPTVKTMGGAASSSTTTTTSSEPQLGSDMGGDRRACAPGDNSPSGTVLNGYRKVVSRGLMGNACYWEQTK